MYQILALAALCAVARHQDIRLRHDLSKHFAHLRIGGAYNRAHITVIIAHAVRAPLGNLLAHQFIERAAVDLAVLEFAAGRIGSLYKNEDSFFLFFTYFDEGIDAV